MKMTFLLLLVACLVPFRTGGGETPHVADDYSTRRFLPIAVYYSDLELAKHLARREKDLNVRFGRQSRVFMPRFTSDSFTLIHIAVGRKDIEMVRFLVANGADPNIDDGEGMTPLLMSLLEPEPSEEFSLALLALGVSVRTSASAATTPLHRACRLGFGQLVRAILARKPNINARDSRGRTPLHRAMMNIPLDEAMVLSLVAAGADTTAQIPEDTDSAFPGFTMLDLAQGAAVHSPKAAVKLADFFYDRGTRNSRRWTEELEFPAYDSATKGGE